MDAEDFATLAQQLHAAATPETTAEAVVDQARASLGANHGGITLLRAGGKLQTIAPSDELVVRADHLQYSLDEGPCRDSVWEQQTLASQHLRGDRRWPRWAPRAADLGIASVLAAELTGAEAGQRLGSLNLYWTEPATFSRDDLAYATIYATHAAVALSNALRNSQLNTALDARKLIGQAQGILMERHGLSGQQAFEVLRRYSQNSNLKLRDVADRLVTTRRLPAHQGQSADAAD